jgi:hypothetical protein
MLNHNPTLSRPKTITFHLDQHPNRKHPINIEKINTADISHTLDRKGTYLSHSFIPKEFSRDLTTPIPIQKGNSFLDQEENTWHTQIFPSNNSINREEVANIGQWLNDMLKQNKAETKDPLQLAANARHWFSIAFDELCRQISLECSERSILLLSIWKRYKDLFLRVIQLHQEEKEDFHTEYRYHLYLRSINVYIN